METNIYYLANSQKFVGYDTKLTRSLWAAQLGLGGFRDYFFNKGYYIIEYDLHKVFTKRSRRYWITSIKTGKIVSTVVKSNEINEWKQVFTT